MKKIFLFMIFISMMISVFASTVDKEKKLTAIQNEIAMLEKMSGGRLGVSAINTSNNMQIDYRSEQRFPFQSTFKVFVAAAILKQGITDSDLLAQKIFYKKEDLVSWSPITKKHLTDGMTVSQLAAAAVMHSDNSATNLLVKKIGGLQAVTAFVHSLGNTTFRLDNWEAELNSNPEMLQDTSTPQDMRDSLQKIVLGDVLATKQREQLITWMKGNVAGDNRIRAGVPDGWLVGDRTGSGSYGVTNDIGVIWPPNCAPIVVAVYFVQKQKNAPRREDVVASVTRLLIDEYKREDVCLQS